MPSKITTLSFIFLISLIGILITPKIPDEFLVELIFLYRY